MYTKLKRILYWTGGIFVFLIIMGIITGDNQPTTSENPSPSVSPQVSKTTQAKNTPETTPKQTAVPTLTPTPITKSYQQVFAFSGNGAKTSEPFRITGSRFKIRYNCTGSLCQAFLEKVGDSFGGGLIMNSTGSVNGRYPFLKTLFL